MVAAKQHDRKLGLCGASLTNARLNRHTIPVMGAVQDDVESCMVYSGYLEGAPFEWVTVSLRFGLKNDESPDYQRIDKEYGDLPLAIELDTNELIDADWDDLKALFTCATLRALIHAGKKYGLPTQALEEHLGELRSTPVYQKTEQTDRGLPARHDRKLVLSASGLVERPRFRVKDDIAVMEEVRNELEQVLIDTEYLEAAPFDWVGLILRFGITNAEQPQYEPINSEFGDLPISIELDVNDLAEANRVEFKRLLTIATLTALIHAAQRYGLPFEKLQKMLHREAGQV